MRNQRNSLSDHLGANVSLALWRAQMEYHAGLEITCGVVGLLYSADKRFIEDELKFYLETILNNNYLHIEERSKFNYR
jgi:hypothetical protein